MARSASRYVCQACGASSARWEGRCHLCGNWDTLVETVVHHDPAATRRNAATTAGAFDEPSPEPLDAVGSEPEHRRRIGLEEVDRVLGGGLVPGSLVLLGGEPGIGKSTLVLEIAAGVARDPTGGYVLYASGEESTTQLRLRAKRLALIDGPAGQRISLLAATQLEAIFRAVEGRAPGLLIVDSIQTMTTSDLDGPAGSIGQVRETAARLGAYARASGVPVVLVGHVTKDGSLAGPRTLEHLVDAVLTLDGDRYGSLRLLRASKDRYGSTDEVGVLEMTADGLRPVPDPGRAFLGDGFGGAPGVAVAATLEGSRPLLVEVQALTAPSGYGAPRRTVAGVDGNRVALLVAVLARRCGIDLSANDLYVSLAGGATVAEPALDAAVALALASAARDRLLLPGIVACGEVSLLGELRPCRGIDRRLREAARLGFSRALVPWSRSAPSDPPAGIELLPARTMSEALALVLLPATSTVGEGVTAAATLLGSLDR